MLFQLPSFLIFFVFILFLTRITKDTKRKGILLIASFFFYAFWGVFNIWLLILYILIAFLAIHSNNKLHIRTKWLILLSITPLIFFKYTDFILNSIGLNGNLHLGLPLGISFITFTLISLIVDYSRKKDKSFNALDISLYISFFPHLIAGPILRSHELIPQLKNIRVTWGNIKYNLPLFMIGMIKKVFIADQIAGYIDPVFLNPSNYGFYDLLIAAIGFSIQIYCDFSAYTDMAIATAGMLGINFPENFRSPYLSSSLTETWQRWHMTLSFWLRDYIFIPLVRRCHKKLKYLPILITMLVSGLWHGAYWHFVLWGAIQGLIMVLESYLGYAKFIHNHSRLKPLFILLNFSTWTVLLVLFRCNSISAAGDFFKAIGDFNMNPLTMNNISIITLALFTFIFHYVDKVDTIRNGLAKLPDSIVIPISLTVILGCSLVAAQRPESFYYFDF